MGDSARRWQDSVNLLLGIFLFLSPLLWRSTSQALASSAAQTSSGWNAWLVAIVIVLMALWGLAAPAATAPEVVNCLAALWLLVAPWVLGFARSGNSSAWSQWAIGFLVLVFAAWSVYESRGTGRRRV